MADKTVSYLACGRICPCDTTDVYLCIGVDYTTNGTYTIPATVLSVESNIECCTKGNVVTYTYTFQYDSDLVKDDLDLESDHILSVICDDCYAKWVKDQLIDYEAICCCIEGNTNTVCGCGTFDPVEQIDAEFNSAFGYNTQASNVEGDRNTSIGYRALYNNVDSSDNICIGYHSGYNLTDGEYNIFIGNELDTTHSYASDTSHCIVIGHDPLCRYWEGGSNNIIIGNADCDVNIVFGEDVNEYNIIIGHYTESTQEYIYGSVIAGQDVSAGTAEIVGSVILGAYAANQIYSSIQDVIIGKGITSDTTSLDYTYKNVIIGYNAQNSAVHVSGSLEKCVLIGADTFIEATKNCIGIGYGVVCTKDNQIIIGNDDIIETNLRRVLLAPGDRSAGSYPIKFRSGPLLNVPEIGTMEFDGDHFYFTTLAGRQLIV